MKIPFTNINIGKTENVVQEKQLNRYNIISNIVQTQNIRTVQDITSWRNALSMAEDTLRPDRTELIRTFNDVILDGHITGIIESIKAKIKSKQFHLEKNNIIDDEKTKLIRKQWFFGLIEEFVNSVFWGYSLVQFTGIKDDSFTGYECIPREYVIPEWNMVKKNLYISDKQSGIYYNLPPYDAWTLFIGRKGSMGLLNKATPHALGKKNLLISAWENAELFGMPTRVIMTDTEDPKRRQNMEQFLEKMGRKGWGVMGKDDRLEMKETSSNDIHKVYIEPMKWSNSEISKAFVGVSGFAEDKAFVGSVEAQERLFDEFIGSFMIEFDFIVNNELLPLMIRHMIPLDGYTFSWDNTERLNITQKKDIIKDLSNFYEFEPEFIESYLPGIKVKGIKEQSFPNQNFSAIMNKHAFENDSIMNKVEDYYNIKCHHE